MTEALGSSNPSFLDSLGERGRRRAEPRTSVSLAAAGCALAFIGVLVLAGDTGLDDDTGDFSRIPGLLLSALVVALGYFVLSATRTGALATAGTVGASLGVPAFMFFLTFDQDGFPPYNTEAILYVTTAVWLGSYLVGPAKGRPWFLGSGLIGFWFSVLELVENVFEAPFAFMGFFGSSAAMEFEETGEAIGGSGDFGSSGFEGDVDTGFGGDVDTGFGGSDFEGDLGTGGAGQDPFAFDPPDPATVGLLSLALGVAFVLIGRWLDRNGRHGMATPFAFAAIPCLAAGVIGLSDDLEASGSGLLLVVIGVLLAWNGSTIWRRGTSWIGGATAALGLAIFLGDMAGDSATTGGMLYIAGGFALVFGGHLLATATGEPDEMALTTGAVEAVTGPRRQILVADAAPPEGADDVDDDVFRPPPPPPPASEDGPPPPG